MSRIKFHGLFVFHFQSFRKVCGMWHIRWRVCLWTCLVVAGAVGIGRMVQVLSVDGGSSLTGVDASFSSYDQSSQEQTLHAHKLPFNGTLGMQMDELVWFMQVRATMNFQGEFYQ